MTRIRKVASSSKKFVEDHRVAITVTLTTTICLALHVNVIRDINDFLKKNDLYEEYYTTFPEE